MSLHYIFWHWPRPDVDLGVYAGKLVRFQEELENSMGGELQGETASYRSAPPPWVPAEATSFSDWYAMVDSSKLDLLNASAVNAAVRPAHNELAALYGGGAGSLYDYKRGAAFDPAFVQYTFWFAKPPGMSYDDLYTLLAPVTESPNTTLMRRRMVLGPSPEFCIASEALHELPAPIAAQVLQMNRL
jgi:hypothetical protein